jgi:DNA-binding PadR family transcriptional regulator
MVYALIATGACSPGTLYPMLHAMERKGYLESRTERAGRSHRRVYRATPYGLEALKMARKKGSGVCA